MKQKILILVDSASTITPEIAKKYDIEVLPLSIYRNDGQSYIYEALKMTGEEFLKMGDEGYKFSTSCTPQGILEEVISIKLKEYDCILALPINQKWSSQYDHIKALSLQPEYQGKLFVANTVEFGYAIECLAIELREMINSGSYTMDDLVNYANDFHNKTICFFACKELQGLVNSGRVPRILAKGLKLLKIKPIIRFEGENHLEAMLKNFSEVINRFIKATLKTFGGKLPAKDIKSIAILNIDNSKEYLGEVVSDLVTAFGIPKDKIVIKMAPNIFVNIAGHEAIGVHFITNKEKPTE